MVHVATPRPSIGSSLGQALGELAGNEFGYQRERSRTLQALDEAQNMAGSAQNSTDLLFSLLRATAGRPGAEKALGQLYPTLLNRFVTEQQNKFNPYSRGQGGSSFSTSPSQAVTSSSPAPSQGVSSQFMGQPITSNEQPQTTPPTNPQQYTSDIASTVNQQPKAFETGGVLPRILPVEEIESIARQVQGATGDPALYNNELARLTAVNNQALEARKRAEEKALQNGIPASEMSEFMRVAQDFGGYKDLDQWFNASKAAYLADKSTVESLKGAFVPGFWRGLVTSPKDREKSLNRLEGIAKYAKEQGREQQARALFAQEGLSPTEVELVFNPFSKEVKSNLSKLPEAEKGKTTLKTLPSSATSALTALSPSLGLAAQAAGTKLGSTAPNLVKLNKNLVNFFKETIKPGVSLGGLRHELTINKGYPWELIGPAIRESGVKLSPQQHNEMVEIETQPPRQSLSEIFLDWWRPYEYIKGSK